MEITGTAQFDAWQRRVPPPVEEVRPGLWSIPVPMPHNPLRYTLCYAFTGRDVVIVDPGWDSPDARAALTAGLTTAGTSLDDVTGIVLTHIHPDHHGLTGWVRSASGAWAGMHPAEAATLPARLDHHYRDASADRAWLIRAGVPSDEIDALAISTDSLDALRRLASPDRLIEDGSLLPIPGREVRAIWTPGHTPGHLCLHDAAAGALLTGDHLLPRITPNIAAKDDTDGDPLGDYLTSLAKFTAFQAEEALPAHEYRFRLLDVRAKAVADHHEARSAEVIAAAANLDFPTAWLIAGALTWSRGWASLNGFLRRMALGETIAHLNHLTAVGALLPSPDSPIHWHPAVP
ncbi:MBL fold metallo-hydrolase [Actinoplanes sp. NPDC051411]|uniref:MBL fold metallo-hydrolase n=1 Tax=Actinoplanes sp. NPDC051411 TaxID=3155522 RepID=UPI00341E79FE